MHEITFFQMITSVPLILIANIIPLTISGLGLRETFALEVLDRYGVDPEIAVATSLSIFLINTVVPSLVGIYYLLDKKGNKI